MKYQIVFSNCEGCFPQKHEVYVTKEEAQKKADMYNEQKDSPFCTYYVKELKGE